MYFAEGKLMLSTKYFKSVICVVYVTTKQKLGLQSNIWLIYIVIKLLGFMRKFATNMLRK